MVSVLALYSDDPSSKNSHYPWVVVVTWRRLLICRYFALPKHGLGRSLACGFLLQTLWYIVFCAPSLVWNKAKDSTCVPRPIVTRLGIWSCVHNICQNFEATLAMRCQWANFHCCKWPNNEELAIWSYFNIALWLVKTSYMTFCSQSQCFNSE